MRRQSTREIWGRDRLRPTPRIRRRTVTAAALLREVRRLILEEPGRLDMGSWVRALEGQTHGNDIGLHYAHRKKPACGTVACLAGWGATVLRPEEITIGRLHSNADTALTALLATTHREGDSTWLDVGDLFSGSASREFDEVDPSDYPYLPPPGTRELARVVARRISTYLRRHRRELERRVIDVAEAGRLLARPRTWDISKETIRRRAIRGWEKER